MGSAQRHSRCVALPYRGLSAAQRGEPRSRQWQAEIRAQPRHLLRAGSQHAPPAANPGPIGARPQPVAVEPQWVLGLRLAERVGYQREGGVGVELVFQLAIDVIAVRLAVLPITLGMEVRRIDYAVERSPLPAELRRFTPGAVAAEHQARVAGRRRRTVLRLDADHASCRVAVKT